MVSYRRARPGARHHLHGNAAWRRSGAAAGYSADGRRRMAGELLDFRQSWGVLGSLLVAMVPGRSFEASFSERRRASGHRGRTWQRSRASRTPLAVFSEREPPFHLPHIFCVWIWFVLLPDVASDLSTRGTWFLRRPGQPARIDRAVERRRRVHHRRFLEG